MVNADVVPIRPGISASTLEAACIRFCEHPEPGSIEIPYRDLNGHPMDFTRYRLPSTRANGQKYDQKAGSGVHAYFMPGGLANLPLQNAFGLPPRSVVLAEGEFKSLSLHDAGIPAIGLPSFTVYHRDQNDEKRLLKDLEIALQKWDVQTIYFLGDSDTCTNFEFSRNAIFLAQAVAPVRVLLPRIAFGGPKGIDDCREGFNGEFDEFFRKCVESAIEVSPKLSVPSLALLLMEREEKALSELTGETRELQFGRVVKVCAAAQRLESSFSTTRLQALGAKIIGINKSEMEKAIEEQDGADRKKIADETKSKASPAAKNGDRPPTQGVKPSLVLPSGNVGYEECAQKLFPVLAATHRFFLRGRLPVELTHGKQGQALEDLKPSSFRSRLENVFSLLAIRQLGHGETVLKPAHCSHDVADVLLNTTSAREFLPSVSIITRAPIFTEAAGSLTALKLGYHDILGGIIVLRDRNIRLIPLNEAIPALLSLLDDFDFVSTSDKSRAVASFISPALRFGGLLTADFPLDLAEADQSQSGKTFRQKLVARLYGERPFVINKSDDRGVGSMSEFVSEGLISGRPFLMFENIRRKIDCQLLESALRGEGSVLCRSAYGKATQVETSLVMWMLSSNKAEVTPDLANRSIICRIRKRQAGHHFKVYPEGDVLQHVQANTDYYLSCVFSVISEWHKRGKPRSQDTRHDFREWCQTLDVIVQDLFGLPALLDGHRAEQQRMSNPDLTWLRDVALAIEKRDRLEEGLKPSEIADLCEAFSIDIPGAGKTHVLDPDQAFKRASLAAGRSLARIFLKVETVETGGFVVRREESSEYNSEYRKNLRAYHHYFGRSE
jgi:Domain of unknown function (DUF3854)